MKKLGLLVMPLMAVSLLASCNKGGGDTPEPEPPEPQLNRWYEYEDWWNYCSNGKADSEAIKDDVGKEVNVTIYDKVHKVRLIDVDHIEPKETVAQAHCTFEFMNVVTDSKGMITTKWNDGPNNYNFPDSTLNKLLNKNSDCIFNQLPSGLQGAIKEVSKKVGIFVQKLNEYQAKSYNTKLFPLAYNEMVDCDSNVLDDEGTIYKYYEDHLDMENRIKRKVGSETEHYGENYWSRSPTALKIYPTSVWYVCTDGGLGEGTVSYVYAVAPAFCI